MENSIVAETTVSKSLRVIFESVWRGFGSGVIHIEQLVLFDQYKLNMGSSTFDRTRLHISRYAQTFRESAIAHLVQFADRDVVALAVLHARVGEVPEQQKNDDCSAAELEIGLRLAGHNAPPAGKVVPYSRLLDAMHGIKISKECVVVQFELNHYQGMCEHARPRGQ